MKILLTCVLLFCLQPCVKSVPANIHFIETDLNGRAVREITVTLSSSPGKACIGGAWKKATATDDVQNYSRNPVYKIENGKFELLLKNGICDAYDSYIGQINGDTFEGSHVLYGWESKTVGKVSGKKIQ